jgi:hypothetical protein
LWWGYFKQEKAGEIMNIGAMNWYRKCLAQGIEQDIADVSSIISKSDLERRMQMLYNQYREALQEDGIMSWKDWLRADLQGMGWAMDSDYTFYQDFLQNAPEGTDSTDLLQAYVDGKLNDTNRQQYQFQNAPILNQPVPDWVDRYPWYPQQAKDLSPQEAQGIYQMAAQRATKSNMSQVLAARKNLFLAFNTDKELAKKLGVKESELNKRMKSYANFNASSRQMHERLNYKIPSEFQWNGIINSSFLMKSSVAPEDVDKFVDRVIITDENRGYWNYGNEGESLRKYIASVFMGIDTRISYRDLTFEVGDCSREVGDTTKYAKGRYNDQQRKVKIASINQNTIAHEIGHYLDYTFARSLWGQSAVPLSEMSHSDIERHGAREKLRREHVDWAKKFRSFVDHLRTKGEISSAYYQEPRETFARFVDKFVRWTNKLAGNHTYDDDYSQDRFDPADFQIFVRLLQEKSYIDNMGGAG